ncbi:MAG TPA: protein translocase subunit SecF [Actinomycetota bacterium]
MSHLLDVYRGYRTPRLKIVEHRNRWFAFSGLLIAVSLFGLIGVGLTYSIDFTGGAQVSYPLRTDVSVQEVQQTLADYGLEGEVQIVQSADGDEVSIRTDAVNDPEESAGLLRDLAAQAGVDPLDINVETIGPTWGATISRKALFGLVVVIVMISLYITIRFQWTMAVGAMIALVHDIVITAGVYALTGREVTPETVIAVLTILGFSLYDTVVIYDKIQENSESPALVARLGWEEVVNLSLNQVIMRSVNTSLVVLLPILSLLLFGGDTLKDFAFAMFIGTAIGAYSSIFIAAPLLVVLRSRETPVARTPQGRAARTAGSEVVAADAAATAATARTSSPRPAGGRPKPKSKRGHPAKRKRR